MKQFLWNPLSLWMEGVYQAQTVSLFYLAALLTPWQAALTRTTGEVVDRPVPAPSAPEAQPSPEAPPKPNVIAMPRRTSRPAAPQTTRAKRTHKAKPARSRTQRKRVA